MQIAVTSASGQLGAAIVQHLINEVGPAGVRALARTPERAAHLGVEVCPGDYNNFNDLLSSLQDIDSVVLVSGNDHPDTRIIQHRNVIEAAKRNGVRKIVYTSIVGAREGNAFSPIVQSNRQTEKDIQASGMQWAIGRNGLYIEPDLEYIETYKKEGAVINCAGEGRCGYTSRHELATAYTCMLTNNGLNGRVYNLLGQPVSQKELVDALNEHFNTNLTFQNISVKAYLEERKAALGEFLGTIIGGIYEGICTGEFDRESHFEEVTGRRHKSLEEMMREWGNM